jgi:hypothetical protein
MVFLHQSNQHMFGDKVFQTIVFSRHMQETVIDIKTLGWSGVLNTLKIPWYSKQSFYMLAKHLSRKNIIVFFNIMVLPQNFKNTLFPNTPLSFYVNWLVHNKLTCFNLCSVSLLSFC